MEQTRRTFTDVDFGDELPESLADIRIETVRRAPAPSITDYRTEAYYFPDHGFAIAVQINTTDNGVLTRSPLRILDDLAGRVITDLEAH